jgi:hypothetical protein
MYLRTPSWFSCIFFSLRVRRMIKIISIKTHIAVHNYVAFYALQSTTYFLILKKNLRSSKCQCC